MEFYLEITPSLPLSLKNFQAYHELCHIHKYLYFVQWGCFREFGPSRGIRQGDYLSLYLFILHMENLGHLIKQKCVNESWTPLKASKDNLGFSHLLFANDIILFSKADASECEVISEVLEKFCRESGQKISHDKSRIYFSSNVNKELKEEISGRLDISETSNIGKYLVFPFKHRGVPKNPYNFIVERVMSKLT